MHGMITAKRSHLATCKSNRSEQPREVWKASKPDKCLGNEEVQPVQILGCSLLGAEKLEG